jgi:hypothetical protein
MKDLLDAGVVSKIGDGVKVLGKGADRLKELGVKLDIEVSDASKAAIETVRDLGGSIKVEYRTPLLMRAHLQPHKFNSNKELKTPMPHNKALKKLERLKSKGLDVNYPDAPWFTDNYEKIQAERDEKKRRMREAQHADLLPVYPAPRIPYMNRDKPRVRNELLPVKFKWPN